MKLKTLIIAFIIIGLTPLFTFSQEKYTLLFLDKKTKEAIHFNKKKYQTTFFDSISAISELNKIVEIERSKGFVSANFDSVYFDTSSIRAFFYRGNKLILNKLTLNSTTVTEDFKFHKKEYTKTPFSAQNIAHLQNNIISYYENNGFPFAKTELRFEVKVQDTIDAIINIQKNNFIQFDSLIINGNVKISNRFMQQYLSIQKKQTFSEKSFTEIEKKINTLTFIILTQKPDIEFTENAAKVYLYLKKKPTNSFSGIIGILPPENENEQFSLTGDMQIYLQNTLSHADIFSLNWQKYQAKSQKMKVDFQYPYLFNIPIGISSSLNLGLQDSSFFNSSATIGFQYYYKSNNYVKIFYQKVATSLLENFEQNNYAQTSTNSFGLGFYYNNLDYTFNPRKGLFWESNFSSGKKIIDSESSSLQYKFESNLSAYIPFFKRMTFHIQNYSGILRNSQLFLNELFRLGGLNTLRGFDEESIFASSFYTINLELKYLFEQNSNFLVFYNQAFYNQKLTQTISDKPFGFGGGFNFQTKAGVFSLIYALGKQLDQPIKLRNAKIHFGYVNRF